MHWHVVALLVTLAALSSSAAPLENEQADVRTKRSEEEMVFGNHQNSPKVKKSDPNVAPISNEDNTIEEEEEEARRNDVDKVFKEDDEEANKQAIDQMFSMEDAPIAEDMQQGLQEEESSGEEEEESTLPDSYPLYNLNDYYNYPAMDEEEVRRWLRESGEGEEEEEEEEGAGREERSVDGRPKRSAIVAEDMMGGVRASHGAMRLKRALTEEQISELLDGGYGGDEYYNYPSFNIVEPDEVYPDQDEFAAPAEDYPEDYREYLEELMDNALMEADEAEREEQQEQLELEEAEREYEEYLEAKEQELEQREEVQKALGLLRIMYENIPDGAEPVVGQREETGPGYRVQEVWEKYLPEGASIDQENVLTDYTPIVYEGQEGIFIPLPGGAADKRSASWGTLSSMPGMRKRGYVGYTELSKREEEKRNSDEYGRLFRLARALRGDSWEDEY